MEKIIELVQRREESLQTIGTLQAKMKSMLRSADCNYAEVIDLLKLQNDYLRELASSGTATNGLHSFYWEPPRGTGTTIQPISLDAGAKVADIPAASLPGTLPTEVVP